MVALVKKWFDDFCLKFDDIFFFFDLKRKKIELIKKQKKVAAEGM